MARLDARGEANPRLFLNSYFLTEGGMIEVRRFGVQFCGLMVAVTRNVGEQMLSHERHGGGCVADNRLAAVARECDGGGGHPGRHSSTSVPFPARVDVALAVVHSPTLLSRAHCNTRGRQFGRISRHGRPGRGVHCE